MKSAYIGILLFLLMLAGIFVTAWFIGNWTAWQDKKKKEKSN